MTKKFHDILEGLYKLRIRESGKLKTVLELYDLEIHQKKAGSDHHRLKMMVKRSIEQDLRNNNFGTRNGNYERNAVVWILGDSWQWEANGHTLKETIVVSVTMSISVQKWHSRIRLLILPCSWVKEKRREPEVAEGRVPVVECLDLWSNPCLHGHQNILPLGLLILGLRVFDAFFTSCCMKEGFGFVIFARLLILEWCWNGNGYFSWVDQLSKITSH